MGKVRVKTASAAVVVLAIIAASGSVAVGAPAASLPMQDQDRLVFNATAQHIGTGPSGQTPIIITIERWSTVDERDALEETFIADGMQALADALRDAPEVGFIRAPSMRSTSWRLRYAIGYDDGKGGRIIRMATDRPISFVEAVRRPQQTWDFNVTLIELAVDADGNGSGTLIAGAEFAYDQTHDTFSLKTISSQPVRLNNVRLSNDR